MKRLHRFRGTSVGIVLGGALMVALLAGGCPLLEQIFGVPAAEKLTVSAEVSAAATVDKTVTLKAIVDGGEEPYTYQWTQLAGPAVTLTNATAAQATFTPRAAGMYKFALAVADSAKETASGSAEVETAVGDIQFVIPKSSSASQVRIAGNPAVVITNSRHDLFNLEARVSVFDPQYTDDEKTEMTVVYELVSVPSTAREQDVSLDREFDTISNQGTGDVDSSSVGNLPSLDGAVMITIRPNPDVPFKTLTNIGTTMESLGAFVPGDYVFRATVTNPDGVQRSRDLTVTLNVEGIEGSEGFAGVSPGPSTIAVKELPAGSPGKVTDKVMLGNQTATMKVSVFPSSTTSYRFYLVDDNGVAHKDYVTQSASSFSPADDPQDVTLTIGSSTGIPPGTYMLYAETFDALGQLANTVVAVNPPGGAGTPVRFHVTKDFLSASTINAALVGAASNNPDAPTDYEGWSGNPGANYGSVSALADVNLDGAPDIVTLDGGIIHINTQGFVDGSTAALRHPQNDGNFGPALPAPDIQVNTAPFVATELAVGDLNGDGLPDIAVNSLPGVFGRVVVFFHTGDPWQPYSKYDDQALVIAAPTYTRKYRDADGDITSVPDGGYSAPGTDRTQFGTRIAIAPVVGNDTQPDLIITDPGFSSLRIYDSNGPRPAALTDFYNGSEGRVYVFAGGASGQLKPGRPDIVASEITETGVTNSVPDPNHVEFSETNAKYTAVYTGNIFDQIGTSLAATADGITVGGVNAFADGKPFATYTLDSLDGGRVADGDLVLIDCGGITRTYEFDTNSALANPANIQVNISASNADLPANALSALLSAINNDADHVVTAEADPADPDTLILTSVFTAEDETVRGGSFVVGSVGTGGGFIFNSDGIVYRIAPNTASTTLSSPIKGKQNSNMGLGWQVAMGNINGTGAVDVVISALDTGDPLGVNTDGAVFIAYDGKTAFTDLTLISGVGANTGNAATPSTITQTLVGASLGVGDVNGDGLEDVFFTEPGFDRIYLIKGATTPASSPELTFTGVTFMDATPRWPNGGELLGTGVFLFGDINGDTHADWLFLDSDVNFGFAGFARQ